MSKTFQDLPSWIFEIEEQSAGVYALTAKDADGRSISATGTDVEELLERGRREALAFVALATRG